MATCRRLRRMLRAGGARIVTRKPGYVLTVGPDEWDVYEFERSIMDARVAREAGQWERCIGRCCEADQKWRGKPFADVTPTATIAAAATALTELRLASLAEWFEARFALGPDPDLISDVAHQVNAHPRCEPLVGLWMQALNHPVDDRRPSGVPGHPAAAGQRTRGTARSRTPANTPENAASRCPGPGPDAGATDTGPAPHGHPDLCWSNVRTSRTRHRRGRHHNHRHGRGRQDHLAVHWAHRVADQFPDGQLYVNLRGFDPPGDAPTPAEAVRGFLDALGVPADRVPGRPRPGRPLPQPARRPPGTDPARQRPRRRPGTPAAARRARRHVLVTSRSDLSKSAHHGGNRRSPAPAQHRGGRGTAERPAGQAAVGRGPTAVDRIIAACVGLPIALAIVAARAAARPTFSLAALADELDETRPGLDGFDGGDPATRLHTVFARSYDALPAPAAQLFRALPLYPGTDIDMYAAAALTASTPRAPGGRCRYWPANTSSPNPYRPVSSPMTCCGPMRTNWASTKARTTADARRRLGAFWSI